MNNNLPIECYLGKIQLIKNNEYDECTIIECYTYIDIGYKWHPLCDPESQTITVLTVKQLNRCDKIHLMSLLDENGEFYQDLEFYDIDIYHDFVRDLMDAGFSICVKK
jgi:hypothetical protein